MAFFKFPRCATAGLLLEQGCSIIANNLKTNMTMKQTPMMRNFAQNANPNNKVNSQRLKAQLKLGFIRPEDVPTAKFETKRRIAPQSPAARVMAEQREAERQAQRKLSIKPSSMSLYRQTLQQQQTISVRHLIDSVGRPTCRVQTNTNNNTPKDHDKKPESRQKCPPPRVAPVGFEGLKTARRFEANGNGVAPMGGFTRTISKMMEKGTIKMSNAAMEAKHWRDIEQEYLKAGYRVPVAKPREAQPAPCACALKLYGKKNNGTHWTDYLYGSMW